MDFQDGIGSCEAWKYSPVSGCVLSTVPQLCSAYKNISMMRGRIMGVTEKVSYAGPESRHAFPG